MKKKHIRVYDRNMNLKAILDKAYKIGYLLEQNNLGACQFTMTLDDPKNKEIIPKHFIELFDHEKRIGMFFVQPTRTVKNSTTKEVTYLCEHVLGLLHSDVLFGYHQRINTTTTQVLQYLLNQQQTKHFVLGTVEFTRYFHYAWESENSLLNAIMGVPKPFDESYLWVVDDTTYPFKLSLVKPSEEVVDEIRYRKNLKGIRKEVDATEIVNRIYPLGYGEGVNQLTIKSVNGGVPYLEDAESINKYGLQQQIFTDRRFKNPESLKATGKALLNANKDPVTTVEVDCIDYELIDPYQVVKYEIGKLVRVIDEDTDTKITLRIKQIEKNDIYGNPSDIQFDLGNVRERLETTIADLEKKQLVNETYSQGSTSITVHQASENADSQNPVELSFYVPEDLVNINKLALTFKTSNFRAYSQGMAAGGQVIDTVTSTTAGQQTATSSSGGSHVESSTTSSGGSSVVTSASGGGQTTSSGGGTTTTTTEKSFVQLNLMSGVPENAVGSENYGNHLHEVQITGSHFDHDHSITLSSHTHTVSDHTHSVSVPSHSHNFGFSIPSHQHTVQIAGHSHDVDINIDPHTHELEFGIFELTDMPTSVTIKVDGNTVPHTATSGNNIDLLPYLAKDTSGRVTRGVWHTCTILPNERGRITANIINKFFVSSLEGDVL